MISYKTFIYQLKFKMAERGKLLNSRILNLDFEWGEIWEYWVKLGQKVKWGQISKGQIGSIEIK